jgi:hypothetical protein
MKRFGPTEKGGLVLAAVFMVFGVFSIVHPIERDVAHPGSGRYDYLFGHNAAEHVTRRGARLYGFFSIGLGIALVWLVFYRRRR